MIEPITGDAFGDILRTCWAEGGGSGVVHEVVERDDGCVFVWDANHYFTDEEEWSPLERQACRQAKGRVLDVGCGAGRHAVVLAAGGRDVVGIDTSPGAVTVSRDRGVNAHLGDVARWDLQVGRFDTFLMLDHNLGLLGSEEHAHEVLANLKRLAEPGARVYGTSAIIDPDQWEVPQEELAYRERNRQRGRMPGRMRWRIRTRRTATEWFDYLFVTPEELATLTTGTGWTLTDVSTDGPQYLAELTLTT